MALLLGQNHSHVLAHSGAPVTVGMLLEGSQLGLRLKSGVVRCFKGFPLLDRSIGL